MIHFLKLVDGLMVNHLEGSYLDGFVKSIYISTEENSTKVLLNEVNRDNDYFIFLPASNSFLIIGTMEKLNLMS